MKYLSAVVCFAVLACACRKPGAAAPAVGAPPPPGATGPAAIKPMPTQLPAVLATVNGEQIERWEIESAVHGLEARAGGQVPPDKRDEVLRGLLDQLVAYHVLAQEARDRKLAASDLDVTARLNQMTGGFQTEQAFQQALAAQGLTLDHLQRQTRMSLDIEKVIDAEVMSKISVQDSEVETFYQQNVQRFAQGESVHASHILITTPQGAGAAQTQQARAKAQQVLKQLRGGADFAALAREQSQDSSSAERGGDLGFVPKGIADPAFEAAAFALKPGKTSGLVQTPFGFHIIKVIERRAARTAPLAEVGGQIKEFLTGQQRDAKVSAFLDQAKAKRKIQLLV